MRSCYDLAELALRGPLKIDRAEVWRVSIPMIEPFRISSGEVSRKDAVIVRISDREAFGWGESSAMPGAFYSTETPDSCEHELLQSILPSLVGRSFQTMRAFELELAKLSSSRFVRIAIEAAAWEMLAHGHGQSLRQFFGLPDCAVPSGLAVGLYDSDAELLRALKRMRPNDYRRLKIKIKHQHDLHLVHSVRQWYGDIPLFVDANADYSIKDIEVFRKLDSYNLMMFEQPFAREDMEGSAALQRAVRTPLCFDESIETADDVHRAAALDACRIVNIKLQRVGGYLEVFRILEACVQHNLAVWMGTMPELGIGSAQALVLATHPACVFPTDVEPSSRWFHDDIIEPALMLYDGHLSLPSRQGLGFEVSLDKLERYSIRHWTFQQ